MERRFLERVAQTNRVKSSGVGGGGGGGGSGGGVASASAADKIKEEVDNGPPSPPWLQPPLGYKQGNGAAMAAAALSGGASRTAMAGRALLHGMGSSDLKAALERKSSNPALASRGSAGLLAMADLHNSHQNLLNSLSSSSGRGSASNLLAAASGSGLSGSAMAQIARNASGMYFAYLLVNSLDRV